MIESRAKASFESGLVHDVMTIIALFDACITTWKMGFGAIIVLLGGKSL
jgi:hypothetical protein